MKYYSNTPQIRREYVNHVFRRYEPDTIEITQFKAPVYLIYIKKDIAKASDFDCNVQVMSHKKKIVGKLLNRLPKNGRLYLVFYFVKTDTIAVFLTIFI